VDGMAFSDSNAAVSTGSQSLAWTVSGGTLNSAMVIMSIAPAAAGASAASNMLLMGV
jgi:hypothetical protein